MTMKLSLLPVYLLGVSLFSPTRGWAEAPPQLVDLSANEYAALERISVNAVAGTISFLAADELEGRGTPSRGLKIATAYAASRLRAAGATGLGPAGSFYLESSLEVVHTSSHGLTVRGQDGVGFRSSLLDGRDASLEFQGEVPRAETNTAAQQRYAGPVLLPVGEEDQTWPPPTPWLRREANRLQQQGATAILLEASSNSTFWDLATTRQQTVRVDRSRDRYALPIVVVEAGSLTDNHPLELSIPANIVESTTVRNVAGIIRGSDSVLADDAVLFTAHIDHLGLTASGEDRVYNGADDDATGVTAVLGLADAYGSLETAPRRSVIFTLFWGEELGLLGSKQFAEASPWPLDKIIANINIEMIGRPEAEAENKMWMTGWEASDLGELMNAGSRRLAVETFQHPSYSARLYRASDNFSFVQQGVIAHSFSAGSLHDDYHQPSDEWEKLNLPHMSQVMRGLFAGSLPIAQGEVTPSKR